jgi:hypothetical protein
MNRLERPFPAQAEAEVRYHHTEFKVIRHGSFVRCAVTGQPIKLDDLRYWSVELQEAYSGPEAVLDRLRQIRSPTVGF